MRNLRSRLVDRCTMLKVGFSASTGFKEGRPLWGQDLAKG